MIDFSLLQYFQYFRPGHPHQLAAIQQLQEALPEDLKAEDAAWREVWAASGMEQWVLTPYFTQLDNPVQPLRECLTSSAAMVAAKYRRVSGDVQYAWDLKAHGDTTSVFAHIETLEGYGLSAEFRFDGTAKMIEDEIRAGRPVMVGWLHRGPIDEPTGIGHWSVIVGFNRDEFIMHDPAGEPRLIEGGHVHGGGRDVRVNRNQFLERWQIEGKATGWMIIVKD
jgi:hypothetical protein